MRMMRKIVQGAAATSLAACAALAGLASAGCEDAARRPVQGHPPKVGAPQVAQASQERKPAQAPAAPGNAAAIAMPLPVDSPVLHRLILPKWPKADGRDALIEQVEAAFQAGEREYKAGHLQSARRDFDHAVDWLLESGYDLQSDARLEKLFNNIVDSVYAYEQ